MTRYFVTIGGRTIPVDLEPGRVLVDGEAVDADLASVDGSALRSLIVDGASYSLLARRTGSGRWGVRLGGRSVDVEVVDERTQHIREMAGAMSGPAGPRPVKAPMPGLVIKVEVAEGDTIRPGQGLVIVEAMKMENELRAEAPARVRRVLVTAGETVEKDQVLIEFASLESSGEEGAGTEASPERGP